LQKNNILSFLDVDINNCQNDLKTSVHTKETSSGDCINYLSLAPQRYKTGVIKTMLHRAYKICSDWEAFHNEVNRLKQLFTNNNFPMDLIDKEINKFLQHKFDDNNNQDNVEQINIFYRNQMSSQHKQEEQMLRKIIDDHLNPRPNSCVKLSIFYKNLKLSQIY
jgi:hypothetical protein